MMGLLFLLSSFTNNISAQQNLTGNGDGGTPISLQPNINAENMFNTKTMTLGNNVKTLSYPYSR